MSGPSIAVVVACLVTLGGCVAAPGGPRVTPPADLTVDAVVGGGGRGGLDDRAGQRFVVFADGALHHATDVVGLPPLRRVLDHDQMAGLWAMVDEVLASPATGDDGAALAADGAERVALVRVAHQGVWTQRRLPLGDGGPGDALLGALGRLAWAGERPAAATLVPKRYDFGPDPYARYRR